MNAPAFRSGWIKWLLLALLVIAIALGVTRALGKRKAQNEAATAAAVAAQKAPVYEVPPQDVATVEALDLAQSVGVSGSLRALQTAAIKARVAGEVQGIGKREGDAVKEGEVLARIDSTEAQAARHAERIRTEVGNAAPILAERRWPPSTLSVSIGIACPHPDPPPPGGASQSMEQTGEDLFRTADRALYQAKASGRNCISLTDGITVSAARP